MGVGRKQKAIPIIEPISLTYGKNKHKIKDKFLVPIKSIVNGGARIQLSGDYADYWAIVLITNKRVIS